MLLGQLCDEMKAYAKGHVVHAGDIADDGCLRGIEVSGRKLALVLTFNNYPDVGMKAWQLSIVPADKVDRKPIGNDLAVDILRAFFGRRGRVFELPPLFPDPLQRQFVVECDE
jgi:hypothetical protein